MSAQTLLERDAAGAGRVIHIPQDFCSDDPIVIHHAGDESAPRVEVIAERGARATILERFESAEHDLIESTVEIRAGENSYISYATLQLLPPSVRFTARRSAVCERNATVAWSSAELGAYNTNGKIDTRILGEGAHADVAIVFFPNGSQRVDLASTIEHEVGHSTSDTIVKSAATDRGQGTFLGTIRIEKDAQGTDARLRDDALLLSENAHIDSIPALEIAANDVKAFHGATVGAIDTEQLFYLESRGVPLAQAKNMIALGFFEPALERFPTEQLREEIRAALAGKIS